MFRRLLLAWMLLGSFSASSQDAWRRLGRFLLSPDSINTKNKIVATYGFDSRSTLKSNNAVQVHPYGIVGGIAINPKHHKLLLGYHWFDANRPDNFLMLKHYSALAGRYYNLGFWHSWYQSYRLSLYTPIELGIGAVNITNESLLKNLQVWKQEGRFVPLQVGLAFRWKATRYVGLSTKLGYAWVRGYDALQPIQTGPYYLATASVSPLLFIQDVGEELIRRVRKNNKKAIKKRRIYELDD